MRSKPYSILKAVLKKEYEKYSYENEYLRQNHNTQILKTDKFHKCH